MTDTEHHLYGGYMHVTGEVPVEPEGLRIIRFLRLRFLFILNGFLCFFLFHIGLGEFLLGFLYEIHEELSERSNEDLEDLEGTVALSFQLLLVDEYHDIRIDWLSRIHGQYLVVLPRLVGVRCVVNPYLWLVWYFVHSLGTYEFRVLVLYHLYSLRADSIEIGLKDLVHGYRGILSVIR